MGGTKEGAIKAHATKLARYGQGYQSRFTSKANANRGEPADTVAEEKAPVDINDDYLPSIKGLVLLKQYPDEKMALDMLLKCRYGNTCPKCGRNKGHFTNYESRRGGTYTYSTCNHGTSPKTGTIFALSSIPLLTWYDMLYEILVTDGLVTTAQLTKILTIDPATARKMRKRLLDYLGMTDGRTFSRSSLEDK